MSTRRLTTLSEMMRFTADMRSQAKSLALVPTMGALHEGHLSLIRRAKQECNVAVVSIFVNPTQFGPTEDLARYPRSPEKDLALLGSLDVEAVFAPCSRGIYPPDCTTFVDPGHIATVFEGALRPGHFRGVATVVLKLFNIVSPDMAFFGQKDFQQTVVIRRLVEDLNFPVRIALCPIVREADGLAKSSRNVYLNAEDRKAALVISRSLKRAEEMTQAGEGNTEKLLEEMRKTFDAEPRAQLGLVVLQAQAGEKTRRLPQTRKAETWTPLTGAAPFSSVALTRSIERAPTKDGHDNDARSEKDGREAKGEKQSQKGSAKAAAAWLEQLRRG